MSAPLESKVKAGTVGAAGGGVLATFLIWGVGCVVWRAPLDAAHVQDAIAAVPVPVSGLLATGVPALVSFAAGWRARHTSRPDLEELASA